MNENYELKMVDMMMKLLFRMALEEGEPIRTIIDKAIKGEEHNKDIAKQIKKVTGKKPSEAKLKLYKLKTKLHILEAMLRDDTFDESEDRREEFANYLIKFANELKDIKGDCNE